MEDKKNILIGILSFIVVSLLIGYIVFTQMLSNNGPKSQWNVKITEITETNIGKAIDQTSPSYTDTSANFDVMLKEYGDSITYTITVKNEGKMNAKFEGLKITQSETSPIKYFVESQPSNNSVLSSLESTKIVIKVFFDDKLTSKQIDDLSLDEKTKKISLDFKYKQVD